jgi:hypothetical protein
MSCTTIRQRLLASERPDQPGAAEAAHLSRCPACRAWLHRLARLEEMLPQLPVPPSEPPAGLLEMLRAAPLRPLVRPTLLPLYPVPRREGARQKLALAAALAAALALFALGWWALPHTVPPDAPPQDAFRTVVAGRLENARTPHERVAALARLSDELVAEACARPGDARLAELALHFRVVVMRDLPQHAREVPGTDRAAVLGPVASRLGRVESEVSRLAALALRPATATQLRRIAQAARDAERHLRTLCPA